jgi:serine phosphatase RsbU (regulator of sigma subunit)
MEATRAREHMQGELAAARDIQLGILPAIAPAPVNSAFSYAVFLEPAKEIGGDFYDFFQTEDGRYALVLGDVSGKGVPAACKKQRRPMLATYSRPLQSTTKFGFPRFRAARKASCAIGALVASRRPEKLIKVWFS